MTTGLLIVSSQAHAMGQAPVAAHAPDPQSWVCTAQVPGFDCNVDNELGYDTCRVVGTVETTRSVAVHTALAQCHHTFQPFMARHCAVELCGHLKDFKLPGPITVPYKGEPDGG